MIIGVFVYNSIRKRAKTERVLLQSVGDFVAHTMICSETCLWLAIKDFLERIKKISFNRKTMELHL